MTQARSSIVTPGQPGYYHCVTLCVRRAWLCGFDRYSGKDYEHRKPMVVARIRELASIFSVALMGYAVMSNHLHLVLSVEPETAGKWSDDEVAERWLRLFPSREPEQVELRRAVLLANAEALALRRARLADLSWFMRCLDEFVARRANAEDKVKGRFWEGRFKCQHLADDRALAAAMAYVDLNPIRAGMAESLEKCDHTSVQQRLAELRANPEKADMQLEPIAGFSVFRFPMTASQYIDLVDWTGRQVHPGKRGKIAEREPPALRRLGLDANHWTGQVRGVGCGYWRVVGSAEALVDKAAELGIKFLRGIGYARNLAAGR